MFLRFTLHVLSVLLITYGCQQNSVQEGLATPTHIDLEGEDNFRDLGGMPGKDDRTVQFGKLFRSGELSDLTREDQEILQQLGIKKVIDLRTEEERRDAPDNLPPGIESMHLPLISDLTAGNDSIGNREELMALILQRKISGKEFMTSLYGTIDSVKIENWKNIFNILEAGEPAVWHCTAGKDRAGMTTALVLTSLGVDRARIIEDFLASNQYLEAYNTQTIAFINAEYGDGSGDALRPLLGVEEDYISAFFAAVDKEYGGMDNFLTVLDVDVQTMQENYLIP